jgi:hypothetical protein
MDVATMQPAPTFRETRVVAGRETPPRLSGGGSGQQPQRAFSGDMKVLAGMIRNDLAYPASRRQRKTYLGIGRAGHGRELLRRQKFDAYAALPEFPGRVFERTDNAVDLRIPGICHEQDRCHLVVARVRRRSAQPNPVPLILMIGQAP